MEKPTFFIVGAAKAGTTSLVSYLGQHPDVFFPQIKEPKYYSLDDNTFPHRGPGGDLADSRVVRSKYEYDSLFADGVGFAARGEASVDYLFFPSVAEKIKNDIPDAKIIIVLRNPVDRAYSAYMHYVRDGWENLSFEEALIAEPQRIEQNWEFFYYYRSLGFYARQIKRYKKHFSDDHIKILIFEDLVFSANDKIREIFEFIDVDSDFSPNVSERLNVSGKPKSKLLQRVIARPNAVRSALNRIVPHNIRSRIVKEIRRANLESVEMRRETREELKNSYRNDIIELESLLDRDLAAWK